MGKHPPLDFLVNNENVKLCSVCGEKKKLSFEHMPPKESGNLRGVNIIGLENMTPLGGYLEGKFTKSPRGFGGFKLCEDCNKKTGSWYAPAFIDLSKQISKGIAEHKGKDEANFICTVKPLNFLKQVVTILLCADQANGILRQIIDQTNFVLDKHEKNLHTSLSIGLSFSLGDSYRFKGFTPGRDSVNGYTNFVDFQYYPFYFRLALENNQMLKNCIDLMTWSSYDYDEEVDIGFIIDLSTFNQS